MGLRNNKLERALLLSLLPYKQVYWYLKTYFSNSMIGGLIDLYLEHAQEIATQKSEQTFFTYRVSNPCFENEFPDLS